MIRFALVTVVVLGTATWAVILGVVVWASRTVNRALSEAWRR